MRIAIPEERDELPDSWPRLSRSLALALALVCSAALWTLIWQASISLVGLLSGR